jgi:hypothetical protein
MNFGRSAPAESLSSNSRRNNNNRREFSSFRCRLPARARLTFYMYFIFPRLCGWRGAAFSAPATAKAASEERESARHQHTPLLCLPTFTLTYLLYSSPTNTLIVQKMSCSLMPAAVTYRSLDRYFSLRVYYAELLFWIKGARRR